VKVRPAALKNEEAQKARKQHANDRAGVALVGYDVTVLHGHQYYAFIRALSTLRHNFDPAWGVRSGRAGRGAQPLNAWA
jgi:hypothetical protein